ncbi:MAG: SIS domain-containing protein [Calditrichota bacterium]
MAFKHINLTAERVRSLDPHDMLGKTLELPEQILKGLELGGEFAAAHTLEAISDVEWIGLGGSAIAGDLLKAFGFEPPTLPLQINVQRFPRESQSRRILCSYSGNTVETVRTFEETSKERIWFSMSSSGKLRELAAQKGTPHLTVPSGYPPRAAVGFVLGAMCAIFERVYHVRLADYQKLAQLLKSDADQYRNYDPNSNAALALAVTFIDRTPVCYAADGLTMPAIATRFRAQLAENAKVWSHAAELPELAHNEVESFEFIGQLLPKPRVLLLGNWVLEGQFTDPRPGLCRLMDSLQIEHHTLAPSALWKGETDRIRSGLRMMLLLDAATVYLALLRAVDPLEIPIITKLKKLTSLA